MDAVRESCIFEIGELVKHISKTVWEVYAYGYNVWSLEFESNIEIAFSQIKEKCLFLGQDSFDFPNDVLKAYSEARIAAERESRHMIDKHLQEIVNRLSVFIK